MSKFGYLEVFQRVPSTSRQREWTVFVFMYFEINGHLKSAEIKTTENLCILFAVKTAKTYTHRNNPYTVLILGRERT